MKKIYVMAISAIGFVAIQGLSQQVEKKASIQMNEKFTTETSKQITPQPFDTKALTVLWEDDFETGATGGSGLFTTSNGDYTATGDANWELTAATTVPTLGSPTQMTGKFLRWHSYISNEPNGFATTPVNGAIITPSMDLSGATDNNISLSFKTHSYYCCHPQEFPWAVSVSTDGGTTFGAEKRLDFGVDRQVETNNLVVTLDLSSDLDQTAANNNDVVIEFRWVGDNIFNYQSGNYQYNTAVFWDIDELVVYQTPDYDLEIDKAWTGDIITDYEVTESPESLSKLFTAQAKLINNGINVPTGVQLKVDIKDAGGTSVATETGGTLIHGFSSKIDTITFATSINLNTLSVGEYTVEYTIEITETDEYLPNNTASRSISITDFTYATYNKDSKLSGASPGFDYGDPQSSLYEMGNIFQFDVDQDLNALELATHPGYQGNAATVGEIVEVNVYEVDQSQLPNIYTLVGGPFTFEVTADKFSYSTNITRYVYNLNNPDQGTGGSVYMEAGKTYWAGINHYGGSGLHFFYWGTATDDDNSTTGFGPFGQNSATGWYVGFEEPALALNFDESLNVNKEAENIEKYARIFPNPTSDEATISYVLDSESNVSIEVRDLSGKLLFQTSEKNTAGSQQLTINTSDFASGMYTYSIITDNAKVTKKFIVNK